MTVGQIILLGAIQGVTEFLPVSSSGHLVLARLFLKIPDAGGTAIDAFLHLGTLLAVLVYYRHTWQRIFSGSDRLLTRNLVIATIPAAAVGFLAQNYVDTSLRSVGVVAAGLLFTAIALLLTDVFSTYSRSSSLQPTTYRVPPKPLAKGDNLQPKNAFFIGLAQVIALVPGISRSGVTIAAGRAQGLTRRAAADFSFLLSAPIIAGAGLASLLGIIRSGTLPFTELLIGFAVSFVFGLLAISLFLKIIKKTTFLPFIIYLVAMAIVLLIYV